MLLLHLGIVDLKIIITHINYIEMSKCIPL